MLLVAVAIVFLWVGQVLLYEPNYMNTTMDSMYERVLDNAPELEEIEQIDPYNTDNPLHFLSKTVIGTVFLVDENGNVLYAYSGGRMSDTYGIAKPYNWLVRHYADVIAGNDYKEVVKLPHSSAIAIGVRSVYQGRPVAILLYNSIIQIDTMRQINRQQLLLLTLVLTLVASLISFFLARHFSKPIQEIKGTVDKLTEGDLAATPKVQRGDELGQLSNSVVELGQELQRVDILRQEVIANVSHELRAPLALITGYGEMVRDVTGPDELKRTQNMNLIIHEANRLEQMVDDIMDYSQMQAGYEKLHLGVYNLYELVESSVQYGQDVAGQYDISILFDAYTQSIPLEMDALKISQVLRNLLNNAINHTQNGESIEVKIVKKDSTVHVAVCNPGKEIPPDEIKQIWERYRRVQHQGGHKEGTGIGLAIVSTILTAHGMEYGVNRQNGCNCFWFAAAESRILAE